MSTKPAAKKWSWVESLNGEPIYHPPYHGIHESLFAFACRSAEEGYTKDQTCEFIQEGLKNYDNRRDVSDHEISGQVQGGFKKALNEDPPVDSPFVERFDRNYAQNVFEERRATLEDLAGMSPFPPPASIAEALSTLYMPYELINLGYSIKKSQTCSVSEWLERKDLGDQEFLVPQPMTARFGVTQDGRPGRPRTQSNTGARRWVIVDLDHPDPDWQPSLVLELAELSGQLPSVVLWSGQKSLHSWWKIRNATPEAVVAFENEAIRLGADRAFFGERGRAQMARLPMATRKSNGNTQKVVFWNVFGKEDK